MKEVGGIKSLSICAIATNGVLLAFLLIGWSIAPLTAAGDIISFVLVMAGVLLCLLYPVQLLITRRRYYRSMPISAGTRTFVQVVRIIQLLLTISLAAFFSFLVYGLIKQIIYRRIARLSLPIAILSMGLTIIGFNLAIFFKGGRLLKQTNKNYIDEVMASFDNADLPKQ